MAKKIFLPTNDEIAMMKLEKNKNKTTKSNEMFFVLTNEPQIKPRMLLEGVDAMKAWKKENELQDDN